MIKKDTKSLEGYCHNCMVGSGIVNVEPDKCKCSCHKHETVKIFGMTDTFPLNKPIVFVRKGRDIGWKLYK